MRWKFRESAKVGLSSMKGGLHVSEAEEVLGRFKAKLVL